MAAYRLYCLDGAGGINTADWIDAPSDDDAVRQAKKMKNGALKCEIWRESHLVGILGAQDLAD